MKLYRALSAALLCSGVLVFAQTQQVPNPPNDVPTQIQISFSGGDSTYPYVAIKYHITGSDGAGIYYTSPELAKGWVGVTYHTIPGSITYSACSGPVDQFGNGKCLLYPNYFGEYCFTVSFGGVYSSAGTLEYQPSSNFETAVIGGYGQITDNGKNGC